MKSVRIYKGIIAMAGVLVSSCSLDNLNLYPLTQLSEGNYYNTEAELKQTADDVYRQLGRLANAASVSDLFGELYSDNTEVQFTYGDVDGAADETISNFSIRASNSRILSAWNTTYNAIFICNNILMQAEQTELPIDQNLKNQWIGEALTVRSYAYFNLVRAFGDIPLILNRISPAQAYDYLRENQEVVYEQIIADLVKAKSYLPDTYSNAETGRLTNFAASALLAKIYLTRNQKGAAQGELEYIIKSGRFSLDANGDGQIDKEDFRHNFLPNTKNSRESIFEAQYMAGANAFNSNHQSAYVPFHIAFNLPGVPGSFRGRGVNVPSPDLLSEFESGDPRRTISIMDGFIDQTTGNFVPYYYTNKFLDENWANPGQNFEIIRYADILLMYAEVTGDPAYLNAVRERVGLPAYGSEEYPSSKFPTFELAIEHERRMELTHEMHRSFDLKRTGRFLEVLKSKGIDVSEKNLVFPIPESVIDVMPEIKQNPGY